MLLFETIGPRLLVFIAGGATYGEVRIIHELSQKFGRQVVLGSTGMINSDQFLQMLGKTSVI